MLTKEQAIELGESRFWETMTHREIAVFQFAEPLLCMPFDVFHEAVEKTLGRAVFTHEFAFNYDGMKRELLGEGDPPTFDEILAMIPEDKRVVLVVAQGDGK